MKSINIQFKGSNVYSELKGAYSLAGKKGEDRAASVKGKRTKMVEKSMALEPVIKESVDLVCEINHINSSVHLNKIIF